MKSTKSGSLLLKLVIQSVIVAISVSGCGTVQTENKQHFDQTMKSISEAQEQAKGTASVVTKTASAWLMGESVQVAPPESPKLMQNISYLSPGKVNVIDVASYVSRTIGLNIETAEIQYSQSQSATPTGLPGLPGAGSMNGAQMLPSPAQMFGNQAANQLPSMAISYEGTARGLLDLVANKSGVFWRYVDGRVSFFRTLTETIEIPAMARKTKGSSSISATSGPGTAGSSGSSGSGNTVSAGTSTGGISNSDEYDIDVWADLEKTAKIVAGSNNGAKAEVSANKALYSLTVSGTPSQVKNVKDWAKTVVENMSKQVAITATIYSVDVTNEDYFQWNPTIIFNKMSSAYGFNLKSPQAPTIQSSLTPGGFGVSVLNNANATSSLNGTEAAFSALSTIGNVSGRIRQSVVTLNGQQAPMQIGKQKGYIYSTTISQTANVGSTASITPGSVTVGFTAMFTPQVINGKIFLAMDVINSTLDALTDRSTGGASIETTDTTSSTFKQVFSLTSGQAFMVTGVQQDNGQNNQSGMGSPNNMVLGGGVGAASTKKLVAIVITAEVL